VGEPEPKRKRSLSAFWPRLRDWFRAFLPG
jgi:hypothetical protein